MIIELEKGKLNKNFFEILGVESRIQGQLGVGKGEKHLLGQNCSKTDTAFKLSLKLEIEGHVVSIFIQVRSLEILGSVSIHLLF